MKGNQHKAPHGPLSTLSIPLPSAPVLMMVFWMLLGGSAGIGLTQSIWRLLGVDFGEVAIAVPVGGVVGAVGGGLLGLISNARLLVLLMGVFAGSAAGGVVGRLCWAQTGELAGQVAGGLVGVMAWGAWLLLNRRQNPGPEPK